MALWDRVDSLLNNRSVDRVPFHNFILGFCARNVGYPVAAMYNDPEKSFQAQMWTLEQYGFDGSPDFGYASYGGYEFGGRIRFPTTEFEQAPSHVTFPVNNEEDLAALQLPDVAKAGSLPAAMAFSELQERNGAPLSFILGGNFTIAGNLCPPATLCRWMLKKPQLAHRLLELASAHILGVAKHWADTFGAERVIPKFWEPLSSNEIISPKMFGDFVSPYIRQTAEKLLAMGFKHLYYHICGEQNANLPFWDQVPMGDPGIVTFGHQIDLTTAVKTFGEKCIIVGNIDPSIIQTGTTQQVYELCRESIAKAKHAPHGYMLMSGCESPVMAPPYHVYIMHKACEDFGRYH